MMEFLAVWCLIGALTVVICAAVLIALLYWRTD